MKAPPKSFPRMFNKLKTDHNVEKYPRYAMNVDIVRMGVVCDSPDDLSAALKVLVDSMEVLRIKNTFVLKNDAEGRGGYRAILLNLKFSSKSLCCSKF